MSDSNLQYKNKIIPIKTQSRVIFKDIIGHGTAMRKIFRIVEKVAYSDTTIMLNGETVTGKGLIARAIHKISGRKDHTGRFAGKRIFWLPARGVHGGHRGQSR